MQLILVTFFIFIILDDSSELRRLEVRFLKDPANSTLFESESKSESDHKQEYEQEPAPRKRKLQPNKAAKKTDNDEASSQRKKKKKDPELVSTAMFTSIFSNYPLDSACQDVIVMAAATVI